MPRAIFCIHALSLYMFKLGSAPQMLDLYGRVSFAAADITAMEAELEERGVDMPQFRSLGPMLSDQGGDTRRLGEAVNAIINCVASGEAAGLVAALRAPAAGVQGVLPGHAGHYLMVLQEARAERHSGLLSQPEVQGHVSRVNLLLSLERVAAAVAAEEPGLLGAALGAMELGLGGRVRAGHTDLYLTHLVDPVAALEEGDLLHRDVITAAVEAANLLGEEQQAVEVAMAALNIALRTGGAQETLSSLLHPALRLAGVLPAAAELYHTELQYIHQETGDLGYEGVSELVAFLTRVGEVGEAARAGDTDLVWRRLRLPEIQVQDLDPGAAPRYGRELVRKVREEGRVLTHGEIQTVVDRVNQDR